MAKEGKFHLKGIAEIQFQSVEQEVKKLNAQLTKLGLSESVQKDINGLFGDLEGKFKRLQNLNTAGLTNPNDVKALSKASDDYAKALDNIVEKVQKINVSQINLGPGKNSDAIKALQGQLDNFKSKTEEAARSATALFETFRKSNNLSANLIGFNSKDFKEALAAGENMENKLQALQQAAMNRIAAEGSAYREERSKQMIATNELAAAIDKLNQKREEYGEAPNRAQLGWLTRYEHTVEAMKKAKEEADKVLSSKVAEDPKYKEAIADLDMLRSILKGIESEAQNLDLGNGMKGSLQEVMQQIRLLNREDLDRLVAELDGVKSSAKRTSDATDGISHSIGEINKEANRLENARRDVEKLQNTFTNFFSLTNTWNLVKSAASKAWDTVKELDAAMTEIAVVTDMSLKQVWAMRDEYSNLSTEMGAATIDMVNASKLYYQQGLSQVEVTAAATETIKMARIASLDGATATNLMTAAVRGFNMEMTDAAMVNDTYSWLAAKTAADTHEIADAMTRTASIAHSAGASFQNTAAFLTQMIETTREAPENLGTALKTIIARFTEMKKAPDEIGEIDGELIDANALETALRKVGIALRDNLTGEFRNFDSVIMDISSKWGEMTQLQQRYIATTAAGSRQQSRFIALVQNHQRLTELTEGVANSGGAADQQFAETMESLESKMNKMQNALKLFWTNLFNSDAIKGGVDLLTKVIELANGIVDKLPNATSSIAAFGIAFATLKGARNIIDGVFGSFVKNGVKQTSLWKESTNGIRSFINTLRSSPDSLVKAANASSEAMDMLGDAVKSTSTASTKGSRSILANIAEVYKNHKLSKAAAEGATGAYAQAANAAKAAIGPQLLLYAKIGAVIAIIGGLYSTWKFAQEEFEKNTIEGRLSALEDAAKTAEEQAQRTKESYEELLAAKSEYSSTVDAINELKEGTQEWRDAILDANEQVLTLLTNYSELSGGLTVGKGGLLQLDQTALDEAIFGAEKEARSAQVNTFLTDLSKIDLEREAAQQDFIGKLRDSVLPQFFEINEKTANLVDEIINNGLLNGPMASQNPLAALISELSARGATQTIHSEGLFGNLRDISNFKELLDRTVDVEEGFTDIASAANSLQVELNELAGRSENTSLMASSAALSPSLIGTSIAEPLIKLIDRNVVSKGDLAETRKEIIAGYQKTGPDWKDGFNFVFTDNGQGGKSVQTKRFENYEISMEELRQKYAELAGIGIEEIGDALNKNRQALVEAIAEIEVSKIVTEGADKIQEIIEGMTVKQQEDLATALDFNKWNFDDTGEGMVEKLQSAFDTKNMSQIAKNLGFERQEAFEAYLKGIEMQFQSAAEEVLVKTGTFISEAGMKKFNDILDKTDLNVGQASAFSAKLQNFAARNGKDAAESLIDEIGVVLKKLTPETSRKVTDLFSMSDVSTPEGLEEFKEGLLDIIPASSQVDVDNFIDAMITLGNVIDEIDIDKLLEGFQKTISIYDRIAKGSTDTKFSAGDYEALQESFIGTQYEEMLDLFVRNVDGTLTFIGQDFEGLQTAILSTLDSTVDVIESKYEAQIKAAQTAENYVESNQNTSKTDTEFIYDFAKMMLGSGQANVLQTQFGMDARDPMLKLNSMSPEALAEMKNQIFALSTKVDVLTEEQRVKLAEADAQLIAAKSTPELLQGIKNTSNPEKILAYNNALAAQAINAGASSQKIGELNALLASNEERYIDVNGALVEKGKHTDNDIKLTDEMIRLAIINAGEQARMAEAMEGAGSFFQSNLDIMRDTNMTAADQDIAMENIAMRMGEIIGIPLPAAFFESEERMTLLQDAINGSDEAWYELITLMWQSEEGARTFAERFGFVAEDVTGWVQQLNSLNFQIDGTADVTDIFRQMTAAVGSVDTAKAALEQLSGYKVNFKMTTRPEKILTGFDTVTEYTDTGQGENFGRVSMGGNLINKPSSNKLTKAQKTTRVKSIPKYQTIQVPHVLSATMDSTKSSYVSNGTNLFGNTYTPPSSKQMGGYKSPNSNPKNAKTPSTSSTKDKAGKDKANKDKAGKDKADKEEAEKEVEIWENGYDRLYNLVQITNKEIRRRNKLEKQYGRLILDNAKSYKDVIANVKEQEKSLRTQANLYTQQRAGRLNDLAIAQSAYKDVSKYASLNSSTGLVQINWAAIDKNKDVGVGERITEYISELERISGELESIEDSANDIIDQLEALKDLGKEQYLNLEQQVFDALLAKEQEQIDKLTSLDANISTSSASLIAKINESIADARAARAQERALEAIQEKERRLALLKADTSGANRLEIMGLEEQLGLDREAYTDSLIDKAIETMQRNADEASQQRQFQIELAQLNLQHDQENGALWEASRQMINSYLNSNTAFEGSPLEKLLSEYQKVDAMSLLTQADWYTDMDELIKAGFSWYMNGGKTTEELQAEKNAQKAAEEKAAADAAAAAASSSTASSSSSSSTSSTTSPPVSVGGFVNAGSAKIWSYPYQTAVKQYYDKDPKYRVLKEQGDWIQVRYHKLNSGITGWFKKNEVKAYKEGGMVDYTGPAWVDGSKKKPESFLSAKDTQNFMSLRDLLADALKGNNLKRDGGGDNFFEVNIQVDKIEKDYDVDQLANRVKYQIQQDARYRNTNVVDKGRR